MSESLELTTLRNRIEQWEYEAEARLDEWARLGQKADEAARDGDTTRALRLFDAASAAAAAAKIAQTTVANIGRKLSDLERAGANLVTVSSEDHQALESAHKLLRYWQAIRDTLEERVARLSQQAAQLGQAGERRPADLMRDQITSLESELRLAGRTIDGITAKIHRLQQPAALRQDEAEVMA